MKAYENYDLLPRRNKVFAQTYLRVPQICDGLWFMLQYGSVLWQVHLYPFRHNSCTCSQYLRDMFEWFLGYNCFDVCLIFESSNPTMEDLHVYHIWSAGWQSKLQYVMGFIISSIVSTRTFSTLHRTTSECTCRFGAKLCQHLYNKNGLNGLKASPAIQQDWRCEVRLAKICRLKKIRLWIWQETLHGVFWHWGTWASGQSCRMRFTHWIQWTPVKSWWIGVCQCSKIEKRCHHALVVSVCSSLYQQPKHQHSYPTPVRPAGHIPCLVLKVGSACTVVENAQPRAAF